MANAQNVENLEKIKADLDGVEALLVVDYRGLTVKQIQQLRRDVTATESKMVVYKNTLVKRALADLGMASIDDILEGPSAFVFVKGEVPAAAKALKDFTKVSKELEIKGGIIDGEAVDAAYVEKMASLPTKDQLYAMVAGAIAGVARKLAYGIKLVGEQKDAA